MSTASWIVDGILVPYIILPSQHFDSRTRCLEPEKRLMLACSATPCGAFVWGLHRSKDLATGYFPMPSGGCSATREAGHFPSSTSVMPSTSILASSEGSYSVGATASLRVKGLGRFAGLPCLRRN